jgi:hypothetical protein
MAIVKGSVIGNLSGRLGNLSARTVDGKTILAARPSSFNASQEPAVIEIRKKFAVTGSFVKALLALSALYEIWKKVKTSGMSVYNFAFKSNFTYSSAERPTDQNIVTPGGFALPVQAATVQVDNLTMELLALTSASVFTPEEVNLSANGVICYYDPINPADPAYGLITLNSEINNYNFAQTFELNIPFNVNQEALAAKYQHSILFFIVASKNADGKIIQYSATYTANN